MKDVHSFRCFSCEKRIDVAEEESGSIKAFLSDYNSFIKPKLKIDPSESQSMKIGNLKRNSSLVGEVDSKKSGSSNEKCLTESKMKNNERKTLLPVKVCEINPFSDKFLKVWGKALDF